eukprot:CAMPEP_0174235998 /NCGR_PEP_ID=MMETSP0417-20130205/5268_1 /TAXON_ID=242541 /ORGANISM="Mayorella sp, Strain BSH-02190019" /LENGTH=524 /DNA_ID=CAMNT_0015314585 /DNA_START=228 /DNA_END=1802 /DNA_ORIENTATION=-
MLIGGFLILISVIGGVASNNRRFALWLTDLLIQYRWLIVIPVVLPLSALFDIYWYFRYLVVVRMRSAPLKHAERVADIQAQIKVWRDNGSEGLLCTARPTWLCMSPRLSTYKKKCNQIKIELQDILEVDTVNKVVTVEPLVNMGHLTRELKAHGHTLLVTPEFEDLTVGGLIAGYGVEGSSHKYGLFCDLVEWYEVVIADGSVVECTREQNAELFHSLPWSYGSLGFITAVRLRIRPVKPWVHLQYHPTNTWEEMVSKFEEFTMCENAPEFVEAILYDTERGVLMTGEYADQPEYSKINSIGWWFKPWFYKHVESFCGNDHVADEYIPVRQYYHRHTRSIFWELELIVPFGNSAWFRYLLGWLLPPKVAFLKLTQGELVRKYYEEQHVVQDLLVPLTELKSSLEMCHEIFEVYPIWLAAHKLFRTGGMLKPGDEYKDWEMYVDVGIWNVPKAKDFDGRESVRRMERWALEHRTYQTLYADTYMSREEFWRMFSGDLYHKLRKQYNAEGVFMDVYDKVCRQVAYK